MDPLNVGELIWAGDTIYLRVIPVAVSFERASKMQYRGTGASILVPSFRKVIREAIRLEAWSVFPRLVDCQVRLDIIILLLSTYYYCCCLYVSEDCWAVLVNDFSPA